MSSLTDQQNKVLGILKGESEIYNIDEKLLIAIAWTESRLNPFVCRFEPRWGYYFKTKEFSVLLAQSEDTEKVQQAISWGAMQVMGSVARERGFREHLSLLSAPAVGIRYGVLHLKRLLDEYGDVNDTISAYNAGSPRKNSDGTYVNNDYVEKVLRKMGE